jgi:hypothetical protein
MDIYPAAAELLRDVPIEKPVIRARPHVFARAARLFGGKFPDEWLCAVKANLSPAPLAVLFNPGMCATPLREAPATRLHCELRHK